MDVMHIISLILLVSLIWAAAFYQLNAKVWSVLIGVALLIITFLGRFSFAELVIAWLGYLIAISFTHLHQLRQRYLTLPFLARLQKKMPTVSATERDAIEAGDIWWEKELFCGRPDWPTLFAIPRPTLSQEEQHFLQHQVEELCSMLNDWEIIYENQNLPPIIWDYLKKEKFFGMVIPKQYNGLGFSALAHSTVVTKIASRSISAAVTAMVPNSLGPAELLLHYGTDEQKNHYLPKLAVGADIPCFALTGPDAGSDAGSIPDRGIVCRALHEGKEIVGIRLSWDKRYITLAPIATVLGLAFHLYDPDQLLGGDKDIGITLCLIPTSHAGVEIGHRHYPLHLAFLNGPTRGHDVFIPMDWVIGGSDRLGKGWKMLMECLSIGRSISLPALATGSVKMTYRMTGAYARVRRQFNTPIASFEGIEEALGYIAGYTYLLEATRLMTAGAVDLTINPAIVSAIAKYHMTEICRKVVSHGMDVHAGHMIQVGPRNYLAHIYCAMPISVTVEGANILTRNLIIFGQGAIRCHPYILKEIELFSATHPHWQELDRTLMAHSGYFLSTFLRNLTYGLTGGKLIFSAAQIKNKKIKKYQRQLTRMSAALALLADTSLILLGGQLKRRERISARLGDILSQLYLASAVLKYFDDHHQPKTDIDYVCWSLAQCLHQMQIACDDLLTNFPYRYLGKLLNWIIFPYGRAFFPPQDKLHKAMVAPMLEASLLRDRLTEHCYVSKQPDELSCRLEAALHQLPNIEPVWKKLQLALNNHTIPRWYTMAERIEAAQTANILTMEEAQLVKQFEQLRIEIIKVNEFSFDLNEVIA